MGFQPGIYGNCPLLMDGPVWLGAYVRTVAMGLQKRILAINSNVSMGGQCPCHWVFQKGPLDNASRSLRSH